MAKYNITAELYDNPLTEQEGDFTARPIITTTLYNKDIAQRIVEKRTEYRPETITNILDLADQEKAAAVAEGNSVVDGMGQYMISLMGVFDGVTDLFNRTRHALGVSYNPGKVIRKMLADTDVKISKEAATGPIIGKVIDIKTGSLNDKITAGKVLKINGANLKIVGDETQTGVFFVDSTDASKTFKSEMLVDNNPSEVKAEIPALADGQYRLRIVTQYTKGAKQTKTVRTTEYPILLTVGTGGGGGGGDDDRPVIE